jgi:cysteine synthase A
VITMPQAVSRERVALLRAYGARVELTPGSLMIEAVHRAEQIGKEVDGAVLLRQFENPANPAVHERTTAEEIWSDTDGKLDVFVAGIGTGGTISGVGRVLKRRAPSVRVVGVEPARAAILTSGIVGNHQIQGIGAGFVPRVLDQSVLDEVVPIYDDAAFATAKRLAREDGVLAGISSGAALAAALKLAQRPELAGARFVVMLPDSGERYASTALLDEDPPTH